MISFSPNTLDRLPATLVPLSRDQQGNLSEQQVGQVLKALQKLIPPQSLKPLFQRYLCAIRHALSQEQAVIEHAGPIDPKTVTQIGESLKQQYDRPIQVDTRFCPALLAGLRVRIADDVYEFSLAAGLRNLLQQP